MGRFNSSVGILVVRTLIVGTEFIKGGVFQFLGRNSGRSDRGCSIGWANDVRFQFLGRNSGRSDRSEDRFWIIQKGVSIPRSEFWSFGRWIKYRTGLTTPVSIPRSEFWSFGQTVAPIKALAVSKFQFLGRNSGRSDPRRYRRSGYGCTVSIPRSEFWSFGPPMVCCPVTLTACFNSSVGILVVRTCWPLWCQRLV